MKKKKLSITCLLGTLLLLLFATSSIAQGSNVVNVTSSGTAVLSITNSVPVDIILTEGLQGSLRPDYGSSVTLTLPNGFAWNYGVATSVYDPQTVTCNSNGRALNIVTNTASMTPNTINIATSVMVSDQSVAQSGNVICQVGGVSNVSTAILKVATYTAPANVVNSAIHLTSSNYPTIMSGKMGQTIGHITISEDSAGQLLPGGTITLTLPDGAKWDTSPVHSSLNGVAISYGGNPNSLSNALQYVVVYSSTSSGDNIIFINGRINISADFIGDLNITVSGSAGAYGVIKVATVVAPVTATLEVGSVPAQILCGVQNQSLPNFTIRENMAGAISSQGNFTLLIDFPAGVNPALPTVQVTAGDLVINPSTLCRTLTGDNRWCYSVTIIYSSSQPSTITFSNIKVSVDQNLPVGPLRLGVKGATVVETSLPNLFPGATVAARVIAGEVYLTAPVTSSGITVSGLAQLESSYDPGVNLLLVNSSTGSSPVQVFTDLSGNYQFTNVQPGTYNVVATHKGFLKATSSSISVSTSPVSVPALTMKAGDLNGDNRIDILDIATFAKNYGSVSN